MNSARNIQKLVSPLLTHYCQRVNFGKTSTIRSPDIFNYDNQAFYNDIRIGHKKTKSNIRNMDRNYPKMAQRAIQLLTKVRIVDNTPEALAPVKRQARVIHVYSKKKRGCVGDLVLISVNGEMKRALMVGQVANMGVLKARTDTNNVILVDADGNPQGTRITVPIPAWMRSIKSKTKRPISMTKIIAIAGRLV